MSEPLVHFYMPDGPTITGRVLCKSPKPGTIHATEYGNQVTCPVCASILLARAMDPDDYAPPPPPGVWT